MLYEYLCLCKHKCIQICLKRMTFALVDFLQDTPVARGLVHVHPGGRERTYLNEYCITVGSQKTYG